MTSFESIIYSIRTMADGGWRLTIDISEQDSEKILELSALRNQIVIVHIEPEPLKANDLLGIPELNG